MEQENIRLKQHIEKLRRECLEKYIEIEALRQQNQELRENEREIKDSPKHRNPDILFQEESQNQGTFSILSPGRKNTKPLPLTLWTKNTIKQEALIKKFSGNFDYNESPHSLVSINRWEFVIVCPNPDSCNLRTGIGLEEAKKYFHKSFKPEFSKKLKILGENNLIENRAFESLLDKLNNIPRFLKTNKAEKMFEGGRRFQNEEGNVIDYQSPPRDYLTLMRNVLLVKLGLHLGLHTKQVISSNGNYIYILICADEEILKNEAESDGYNLQMEIGEIDLLSLEPVDENFRPLRIIEHKNENVKRLISDMNRDYSDIMELLKLSEVEETPYESQGVTEGVLTTFHEYLVCLIHGLKTMKNSGLKGTSVKVYMQKLIQNCIFTVNRGKKKEHQIKNMWTRLEFDKPISPYLDYFRKIDPATGECKYNHMWKKYETPNKHQKSIFSSIDRLKILMSLIKRQVNIEYLAQKEIINSFFPLQNDFDLRGERMFTGVLEDQTVEDNTKAMVKEAMGNDSYSPSQKGIMNNWPSALYSQKIPLTKIRNYFGEKIGFYFSFISYYSKIVSIPSLIGVVVFVLQRIYNPESVIVVIVNFLFCIYVSVWATVFNEFWKRKENCLAIKWGQTDFKQDEVPRPQFIGVTRRSPVDDDMDDVYFDSTWRYKYYVFSIFVTGVFIGIVIVIVLFLILLRTRITNILIFQGFDLAGPLVSSLNALQIQIMNMIFNKVAVKLTNLENHRTQTEYENSLILKSYVFQFVNSFFSLFYIAFFKSNIEGCMIWKGSKKELVKGDTCVDELYIQFITIFTISFFRNVIEIGKPFIQAIQKSQEFKKIRNEPSNVPTDIIKLRDQIDSQFQLPSYLTRDVDGTLGDYLEIAILFGYITLFAVAFPLSGALAFISLVAEIQVDRYKLLYLVKRPIPLGSKDIGTWKTIFNFNSIASILTNAALICFGLPTFENFQLAKDNRYLIFSIFCLIMLSLRVIVSVIIPDIPLKYDIVTKRHAKIAQRFIKGWEVSDSKAEAKLVYVNPEICGTIQATVDT